METKKGNFIFDLLVSMTMRERLLRSHSSPRGRHPCTNAYCGNYLGDLGGMCI
jgi:hypothetical protein